MYTTKMNILQKIVAKVHKKFVINPQKPDSPDSPDKNEEI